VSASLRDRARGGDARGHRAQSAAQGIPPSSAGRTRRCGPFTARFAMILAIFCLHGSWRRPESFIHPSSCCSRFRWVSEWWRFRHRHRHRSWLDGVILLVGVVNNATKLSTRESLAPRGLDKGRRHPRGISACGRS
jgi:hypothetical protein